MNYKHVTLPKHNVRFSIVNMPFEQCYKHGTCKSWYIKQTKTFLSDTVRFRKEKHT